MEIIYNISYWLSLGLIAFFIYRRLSPPQWHEDTVIYTDEHHKHFYRSSFVDGKALYGSAFFSGIEVLLPKKLPHFFLDAHQNDRRYSSQVFIAPEEKLSLEGHFDAHFQLYAPHEHQSLVLAIITPDVMQVLMRYSRSYDIEVKGNVLRIMSRERVKDRQDIQQELSEVATKLAIEIQHKLTTWNEQNLKGNENLQIIESGVVKIRGTNLPTALLFITVFLLSLAIPIFIMGISLYGYGDDLAGLVAITGGFIIFPVSYFIIRWIILYSSKS